MKENNYYVVNIWTVQTFPLSFHYKKMHAVFNQHMNQLQLSIVM